MLEIEDSEFNDLSFKTKSQTEAFCKWYLRKTVSDIEDEFDSEDERKEFLTRRELHLKVQLDELRNLNFDSAIPCTFKKNKKPFFKIVKKIYTKPMSAIGSEVKNSRFNYKTMPALYNRVVYFGENKECCYAEQFHLDIQRANYSKIIKHETKKEDVEFKSAEWIIYEYDVDLDNILVLTSDTSCKVVGIPHSVIINEWFNLNKELAIPSASQILATAAKKRKFNGILYASARTQTKNNLVIFELNSGELKFKEIESFPLNHFQFT